MALREDFKDDVLDTSVNTNRTFNILSNTGTVLRTDVRIEETTAFEQEGDDFGAAEVNEICAEVNALTELFNTFFDIAHPVGELYITTDASFNPNTATGWHGTWVQEDTEFVKLTSNSAEVGTTGGLDSYTLRIAQIPKHGHSLNNHTHTIPALSGSASTITDYNGLGFHIHSALCGRSNSGAGRNDWGLTAGGAHGGNVILTRGSGTDWSLETQGPNNSDHRHSVTTNASTTGGSAGSTGITGGTEPITIDPYHKKFFGWRRTA